MRSAETLLSSEFASFVHKWRYEKEMDLFRMLCEAVPGTSSGNDLCLATTIFRSVLLPTTSVQTGKLCSRQVES
ncbi:hypothetical protein C8J55DRAFT_522881 [Lentinula edodes]|uniref:Uncharacterized protein n=1 Tax=Lentinula lateritia TaxID=40482 RepID=A0A9W9A026_9AGAR|nr:hypothetical protein C8J55DRAFT_522881 [Lentinula edodes]